MHNVIPDLLYAAYNALRDVIIKLSNNIRAAIIKIRNIAACNFSFHFPDSRATVPDPCREENHREYR